MESKQNLANVSPKRLTADQLVTKYGISQQDAICLQATQIFPGRFAIQSTIVPMHFDIFFDGEDIGTAFLHNDGRYVATFYYDYPKSLDQHEVSAFGYHKLRLALAIDIARSKYID